MSEISSSIYESHLWESYCKRKISGIPGPERLSHVKKAYVNCERTCSAGRLDLKKISIPTILTSNTALG